ncbi:hypothetical protein F3Y22_tig00112925pilonHSYRG00180 [Hibiscus syriacus]|uniref:Retrotransposon Copia-like N-terminal domain-containing protein n=1 Tax=Hibiscus syriacus TaxID=106335 RepID=A0A6A2WSW0_HIBSY|nr:hypothetical protein F3Y22_tig00112925pilonHSYRG00180 [Hibiscus syriacus]
MVESLNDSFDNGANPYYLHQSDNPGMILVSQLLSNNNFHSWKRSMMLALSAKNKLGFVDGSIQAPDPSLVNQFNAWTRANNLVNSWLLNSVSKDIATSLLYHTTAAEMWKDLVDHFQQSNGPHPLPPISKVFSLVVQEENQRNMQSLHPISKPAFAAKAYPGTNTRKNIPLCSHCNLLGHTKDICYKLIGYPPGYNSKNWSSSNSSRSKNPQVIHTNYVVSQQGSSTVTEAFTPEQCQHLIAMLTSQLQSASSLEIPTTSINTAMQGCLIQDLHQVIGKGEMVQGLYYKCPHSKPISHDKFSARALPTVFLGYPPGVNGYRVYDFCLPKAIHDMIDISRVHGIEQVPFEPTDSNGDAFFDSNGSTSGTSSEYADSHDNVPLEPTDSNNGTVSTDVVSIPVRRSSITFQKPSYLQQYYCNNASSKCLYPIEGFLSSSKLSTEYGAFVANISSVVEPSYYHQAVKFPTWRNAMSGELRAMKDLKTCTIVSLPDGKRVVDYVNNTFLKGVLDEEVYMKLPLGYKSELKGSNMVCRLYKSIYGLKQTSRQWFTAFSNVVIQLGFQQSPFEHSLFTRVWK